MAKTKGYSIDITYATFFKIIVLLLGFGFLYLVRDLLLLIFVAIVIASAIDPLVDKLQRNKIPRAVTVLVVFVLLLGVLALVLGLLVPVIVEQSQQLLRYFPGYAESIAIWLSGVLNVPPADIVNSDVVGSLTGRLGDMVSGLTMAVTGIVRGIFSFLVVLVLAFYFVVQEDSFKAFIRSVIPHRHRLYASDLTGRVQKQMGKWLRGQLILVLSIFCLTYLLLTLLGVPNALLLATLAGLFEIVPYIGPILGAIPAAFLALTVSPLTALLVIGGYILVQQLENHVLQPRVMGRVLGLNPLIVILVILVGAKIAGVLGAILAVPVTTAIAVFAGDLFNENEPLGERLRSQGARDVRFYRPQKNENGVDSAGSGSDGEEESDRANEDEKREE